MDVFVISYDLKAPGRDYAPLYSAINGLGEWQHPLESTWVVETAKNENQIFEALKPTLDDNDLLLIFKVYAEARQGWLAKSFWDWMQTKY